VAIDPAAEKLYWANFGGDTISFANLDGSGGGNLTITGATPEGPFGVAIDPSTEKLYWSNFSGDKISFANLDGSGGGTLNTSGVSPSGPSGVALDVATGKIYWANGNQDKIAFANLDDSGGGGALATAGATPDGPRFPVLLNVPAGAGAPAVSGGTAVGSLLSCSLGVWAPDLPSEFDYLAAQSFAYSWNENGTPIPGSTSSSIVASSPGSYVCEVTASNQAGPTTQSSAAVTIAAPSQPPASSPTPTLALTDLSETAKTWRAGNALAAISSKRKGRTKPPIGTTFSFALNEPASVRFTFTKPAGGRKVAGKCVAQTKKSEHRHRCTRTVIAGALTFSAHAGTNEVRFDGRITKRERLKPGSYVLLVTATAAGEHSTTSRLSFTIASGS
jgi:hypothetical protein